ncbi:hypothetical protein, partial [Shigella sonnei]
MKIKTGARILALSALTTMMFSASALAKIEEGKLGNDSNLLIVF